MSKRSDELGYEVTSEMEAILRGMGYPSWRADQIVAATVILPEIALPILTGNSHVTEAGAAMQTVFDAIQQATHGVIKPGVLMTAYNVAWENVLAGA